MNALFDEDWQPMTFKEAADEEISLAFLNADEFAYIRTVRYDGVEYPDIPLVLVKAQQAGRKTSLPEWTRNDHAQGLYGVTTEMFCALADLHGVQPQQSSPLWIGTANKWQKFDIQTSALDEGMLHLGLRAVDE